MPPYAAYARQTQSQPSERDSEPRSYWRFRGPPGGERPAAEPDQNANIPQFQEQRPSRMPAGSRSQVEHAGEEFSRSRRSGELQPNRPAVGFNRDVEGQESAALSLYFDDLGNPSEGIVSSRETNAIAVWEVEPFIGTTHQAAEQIVNGEPSMRRDLTCKRLASWACSMLRALRPALLVIIHARWQASHTRRSDALRQRSTARTSRLRETLFYRLFGDMVTASDGRRPARVESTMRRTTISLPKMDCSAEERLVRMALEGRTGIRNIEADVLARELTVVHESEASDVTAALLPLNLGAPRNDDDL